MEYPGGSCKGLDKFPMDMFTATPRRSNNPHVSDVLHQMHVDG